MINSLMETVHELLSENVLSSAQGLFTTINEQLLDAGDLVSVTPMAFQGGGSWSMVESIAGTAGTAVQTVAGLILGFFIALELVQMLVEKNNLADIDMINVVIKWLVKSFIAIMIVSNAFTIVGAIFTIGHEVITGTALSATAYVDDTLDLYAFAYALESLGIGELIGLLFQFQIFRFLFPVIRIVIFVVVVGRFLEIFMYVAAAPIPLATMANQEYRGMGNNYLKALFALAFQGLLMLIVIAIIGNLMIGSIVNVATAVDGTGFWAILGYLALMCFALMKTPAISKSIFGAH